MARISWADSRSRTPVAASVPGRGRPGPVCGAWARVRPGLMALGLVLATLTAPAGAAAQEAVTDPDTAVSEGPQERAFRHALHRSVSCGTCHAVEERHRARRSWTPEDCAACHHGEEAPVGCTSCHQREDLAAPRPASTVMALSVWREPRVRDLMFDHRLHGEVGCLDCHQGGMSRPPQSCASCHENHHRPEAECANCHVPPEPEVHPMAAHLTCGGSGCHAVADTTPRLLSRTSCELCHVEQRMHNRGRECVRCHILPGYASRE